jgi:hypothetical protein
MDSATDARTDGRIDGGGGDGSPPGDGGGDTGVTDSGGPPPTVDCAPLPASAGTELRVTPAMADELPSIVRDAAPGTVILLEDGTYTMSAGDEGNRRLQFLNDDVTMRSASDDATMVTIDGEYLTNEMIFISGSNVTIAHITITRAIDHPIHVTPPDGGPNVSGTHLYGLRIIDGGEQFIKANQNGARDAFIDDGIVECSYFELTDAGRPNVERSPGGCYTGGIDGHSVYGWTVRNNTFRDIYCAGEGLAEHAVHFWSNSRGNVVENNTIINCARGIGFGLGESGNTRPYADDPYPGAGYLGHVDGIIRNNVVFADIPYYDTGVELQQARGTLVYHNTLYSTDAASGFFSSIDYRFSNTDVDIQNNLVRRITNRDGANGTVMNNVEGSSVSHFEDASMRDFHLSADATDCIDQGAVLAEAGVDIDGETHDDGAPDIGADER